LLPDASRLSIAEGQPRIRETSRVPIMNIDTAAHLGDESIRSFLLRRLGDLPPAPAANH
jgi:hypothetical protein